MILFRVKLACILRELEKFERASAVRPLRKTGVLRMLFEDFQYRFLDGNLPVEGMVRWQALRVACQDNSPTAREKSRELYDWLVKTYLPFPRLHVCLESWTLVLDGLAYSNIDQTLLRVINVLDRARLTAEAEGDTVFVPEKQIKAQISEDLGEKAIRRLRKRLPPELQQLIYSHSGKGLALILPPG